MEAPSLQQLNTIAAFLEAARIHFELDCPIRLNWPPLGRPCPAAGAGSRAARPRARGTAFRQPAITT